jgi:hypothetical protein
MLLCLLFHKIHKLDNYYKKNNMPTPEEQRRINKMMAAELRIPVEQYEQDMQPDSDHQRKTREAQAQALQTMKDAARGGVQGLTLGGSDELAGGISSGMDWLQEKLTGSSPTVLDRKLAEQGFKGDLVTNRSDLYRKDQLGEQARNEAAQQRSPIAYGGSELVGNLATTAAVGGLGAGSIATMPLKEIAKRESLKRLAAESAKRLAAAEAPMMVAGGIQKGLESKNNLIGASPQERDKLASEVEEGTLKGGAIGTTYELGKMALEKMKDSPSVASERTVASEQKQLSDEELDKLSPEEIEAMLAKM